MSWFRRIRGPMEIHRFSWDLELLLQLLETTLTFWLGTNLSNEISSLRITSNKRFPLTLESSGNVVFMIGDSSLSLKTESFSHLRLLASQTQCSHHPIAITMTIIKKVLTKKLEALHREDLSSTQKESESTHSTKFKLISKTPTLISNSINSFKEEPSRTLLMKFQS